MEIQSGAGEWWAANTTASRFADSLISKPLFPKEEFLSSCSTHFPLGLYLSSVFRYNNWKLLLSLLSESSLILLLRGTQTPIFRFSICLPLQVLHVSVLTLGEVGHQTPQALSFHWKPAIFLPGKDEMCHA